MKCRPQKRGQWGHFGLGEGGHLGSLRSGPPQRCHFCVQLRVGGPQVLHAIQKGPPVRYTPDWCAARFQGLCRLPMARPLCCEKYNLLWEPGESLNAMSIFHLPSPHVNPQVLIASPSWRMELLEYKCRCIQHPCAKPVQWQVA